MAIRTDQPEARLVLLNSKQMLEEYRWQADRRLADTLLEQIKSLLGRHDASWESLEGIIVYSGPGSFTGLRIGVTVVNTIAYARNLPIAGSTGEDWAQAGLNKLRQAVPGGQVMPEYGAEPNISKPKR